MDVTDVDDIEEPDADEASLLLPHVLTPDEAKALIEEDTRLRLVRFGFLPGADEVSQSVLDKIVLSILE